MAIKNAIKYPKKLLERILVMELAWVANALSNKIEVESRTVKRTVHPELLDVKPGDELMVVNFKERDERDPIYQSLQERIDELTEDDDDDEGGLVVRK